MAADVRLDEPDRLAQQTGLRGASQDALLLSALNRFGPQGLDQVLGDFAFACWDRATRRLTCARDVFGIRPFAYVHKPGALFAFASLPRGLHGSGIVPKTIDEDALLRRARLQFRFDDSLIAGIGRLPPAHVLIVSHEGLSIERYWQLERAAVGTRQCTPEAAALQLRRLVEEAVACRLPPGGIGAHLSGGLDSSAISVLAARRLRREGRRLHAYSFLDRQRNDITPEDETEFVHAVLAQEGDIDWTPVRRPIFSERTRPLDPDMMRPLDPDEPETQVCTRAEAQGVDVILSGWGGDEAATFNGRGTFAEHLLHGRWRLLAREATSLSRQRGWSPPRVMYGEVLSFLLPDAAIALMKRAVGKSPDLRTLLEASLTAAARKRLAAQGGDALTMAPDGRENRWRLISSPHIAERAEVWAATGARHGVAFAFPLLDRRVVEFALSLPSEHFLQRGYRRRPFREAMADVLPRKVRLRHQKYRPFPSALLDVSERKDELLARLQIYQRHDVVRGVIDLDRLRREIEAFPTPDAVRAALQGSSRQPSDARRVAAALRALDLAEYLRQHASDDGAPRREPGSARGLDHAAGGHQRW